MSNLHYESEPILQVLDTKRAADVVPERFILTVSDGKYLYDKCIICSHLNDLITNNQLPRYTKIQVKKYRTQEVQHRNSTM